MGIWSDTGMTGPLAQPPHHLLHLFQDFAIPA